MSREKRIWHPNFVKYMNNIINNPIYAGLPYRTKEDGTIVWTEIKKSNESLNPIMVEREKWIIEKGISLGMNPNETSFLKKVMFEIHPTKTHVCQTCGSEMSIYYLYPNVNLIKSLHKEFGILYTNCDNIHDIWDDLLQHGIDSFDLASFLIKKGQLNLNPHCATKEQVLEELELACRESGNKCLGPGVMGNPPDRFDGFHSYNRCCRSSQDKGRSKENLKSYTKDRRAYEYWSDGNIHAANQFMGSRFFAGISADHIGPISLGFVHDPRYLQPMDGGDNSSKRDRLQLVDIEKIIETEARTGVYPMSWYSSKIWEYIKRNYATNVDKISTVYRDALKQNMANFMFVLFSILDCCPENGKTFLVEAYLKPNYDCFNYSYRFNGLGEIIACNPRHLTERSNYEIERYQRIAIQSVYDYMNKENRNLTHKFDSSDHMFLHEICEDINDGIHIGTVKEKIYNLLTQIQSKIISQL